MPSEVLEGSASAENTTKRADLGDSPALLRKLSTSPIKPDVDAALQKLEPSSVETNSPWAAIPTLSCVQLTSPVEVWELAADWVGREEAGSLVLSSGR